MPTGRIIKAMSGFYYVQSQEELYQCRGRGIFRKRKTSPLVGDVVEFEADNKEEGYILDIRPRENELTRPPIANVDQVALIFSCIEPDFSTVLLDRFLVSIEEHALPTLIILTKIDLLDAVTQTQMERYARDYEKIGYSVVLLSSKTAEGLGQLTEHLKEKITVFAGQSGVGKSSLLNTLNPSLNLGTNQISQHLGRGKHTTRHVELLPVENGFVADTPGFSSLDFIGLEAIDLSDRFPEMRSRRDQCKFRGCTHINEPYCAVKDALEAHEIPVYRYEHYTQLYEEIKNQKRRY